MAYITKDGKWLWIDNKDDAKAFRGDMTSSFLTKQGKSFGKTLRLLGNKNPT